MHEMMLPRMFRERVEGFSGGLDTENHLVITRTSRDTATSFELKYELTKGFQDAHDNKIVLVRCKPYTSGCSEDGNYSPLVHTS
jgi:hypothetical protein